MLIPVHPAVLFARARSSPADGLARPARLAGALSCARTACSGCSPSSTRGPIARRGYQLVAAARVGAGGLFGVGFGGPAEALPARGTTTSSCRSSARRRGCSVGLVLAGFAVLALVPRHAAREEHFATLVTIGSGLRSGCGRCSTRVAMGLLPTKGAPCRCLVRRNPLVASLAALGLIANAARPQSARSGWRSDRARERQHRGHIFPRLALAGAIRRRSRRARALRRHRARARTKYVPWRAAPLELVPSGRVTGRGWKPGSAESRRRCRHLGRAPALHASPATRDRRRRHASVGAVAARARARHPTACSAERAPRARKPCSAASRSASSFRTRSPSSPRAAPC
jgi:hypothetical protein